MIEKHIKGFTTRKDLEKWLLERSLEEEYAKQYSGEPFKINRQSTYQFVDKEEFEQLNNRLNAINNASH